MNRPTREDVHRKIVGVMDCQPVRIPYPGHRTRIATRISKGLLLAILTLAGSISGIPFYPGAASPPLQSNQDPGFPGTNGSQLPQSVGAGPVPDLRLPHTVVSSIDTLIGAGGVRQASADNLTIYNLDVRMRLFGGRLP